MDTSPPLEDIARLALASLDLTSLNDGDTEADVKRLCQRADGPCGPVAAVCVWPRLAAFARANLRNEIAVAAVANFPDGSADTARAVRDTRAIVDAGAQEVDVVLPYRSLMAGDEASVARLLAEVRAACPSLVLKVILETGVLTDAALITRASELAIAAGADFLKTSTGKVAVNATPAAAEAMLTSIAAGAHMSPRQIGFKAAGGIKTVADAAIYIRLQRQILGEPALTARRFRIGASSLLDDIEAVLGSTSRPAPSAGHY
jgi:deoxyribose-phosphate aldolase